MVLPSLVQDLALCSCKRNQLSGAQRLSLGFILLVNYTALSFDMLKWFERLYLKVLPHFISRRSTTLFQNGYFTFNLAHCVIFLGWESLSGWVLVAAVTLATKSRESFSFSRDCHFNLIEFAKQWTVSVPALARGPPEW